MHVLREILRQKLGLGRNHRAVAASVGVSAGKVAGVFADARAHGLDAAAVEALTDDRRGRDRPCVPRSHRGDPRMSSTKRAGTLETVRDVAGKAYYRGKVRLGAKLTSAPEGG